MKYSYEQYRARSKSLHHQQPLRKPAAFYIIHLEIHVHLVLIFDETCLARSSAQLLCTAHHPRRIAAERLYALRELSPTFLADLFKRRWTERACNMWG